MMFEVISFLVGGYAGVYMAQKLDGRLGSVPSPVAIVMGVKNFFTSQ